MRKEGGLVHHTVFFITLNSFAISNKCKNSFSPIIVWDEKAANDWLLFQSGQSFFL
jgi:hypothetical protein